MLLQYSCYVCRLVRHLGMSHAVTTRAMLTFFMYYWSSLTLILMLWMEYERMVSPALLIVYRTDIQRYIALVTKPIVHVHTKSLQHSWRNRQILMLYVGYAASVYRFELLCNVYCRTERLCVCMSRHQTAHQRQHCRNISPQRS